DSVSAECLAEGGEPLLAVQDQELGLRRRVGGRRLDRFGFEVDALAPGRQEKEHAHRVTVRHGDDQLAYALVVPHVAALEVRQLDLAGSGSGDQLGELVLRCLESHEGPFSMNASGALCDGWQI